MTEAQEYRLCQAAKFDPIYQQLLVECQAMEEEYQRIKILLSPGDLEKLERYVALCEELEYRRTCLAMSLAEK